MKNELIIWNFDYFLEFKDIGQRLSLYNGKQFFSILIRKEMVGYKISEFIRTKSFGKQIHIIKKKKKKK